MSVQRVLPRIKETLDYFQTSKDSVMSNDLDSVRSNDLDSVRSNDLKEPHLFFLPSYKVKTVLSSSTKQGKFLLSVLHILLDEDNVTYCEFFERKGKVTDEMDQTQFIDLLASKSCMMLPVGNIQFMHHNKTLNKTLNDIEIWNFSRVHAKFTKMFNECNFNSRLHLDCRFCDVDYVEEES